MSYGALNDRATRIARHLIRLGVTPGARVAICLPKSTDCFAAALAVWKAGAAFVPIDPDNPAERIAFILHDSAACALITAAPGAVECALPTLALEHLPASPDSPLPDTAADGAAYVIYTSGSSGTPKGVEVAHRALATMTAAWGETLRLDGDHVFLQMANFAFDVAIADLCRALCFGGRLVLCHRPDLLDPRRLATLIETGSVNAGDFTPPVLDALVAEHSTRGGVLDGFRLILCGSDIWSRDGAEAVRALAAPDCLVLHAYGLTETVVDALMLPVQTGTPADGPLPLGRPFVPGSVVEIRDTGGQPLRGSETGEIWIGGPCIAAGYVNNDALNAAAFVPNAGVTFFRTGDLGRINAAGDVEFLGRADMQIKIRGYRIEPQEIEQRLRTLGARQAHVTRHGDQLIGYVTGATNPKALRDGLAQQVPEYMCPAVIVGLDALPLTQNGKIDTAALPAPDFDTVYRPAQDPVAQALARLWQEMLGVARIGLDDHFFERGGHSMLAVRMAIAASDALGFAVDGALIFAHPTLDAFARAVTAADTHHAPLRKRARTATLPATAGQEALWFLAQDPNQSVAYNMPFGLQFSQSADRPALARALQMLVDRHESLRIGFAVTDGRPQLRIPDHVEFLLGHEDVTRDQLTQIATRESTRAFDLSHPPLMRATLAQVSDDNDVLFVTFHHIIADGWSIDLFAQELRTLYTAFVGGGGADLPPLALQFGDYADWANSRLDPETEAAQLAFWNETLASAPALLDLPTDFPRPAQQDFAGARRAVSIDAGRTQAIRALAQRCGTTSFVVMLAAWQYLMARLSGQADIVTGVPDANRGLPETRAMIGYFVNTLAIRSAPMDTDTPQDLVRAVASDLARAQTHKDVPFARVVEHLNPHRARSHSPLFQTMLAWETAAAQQTQTGPAPFSEVEMPQQNAKYDLLLEVSESETGITGSLQFATSLFAPETADRFLRYLDALLDGFVRHPAGALERISLTGTGDTQNIECAPSPHRRRSHAMRAFSAVLRQWRKRPPTQSRAAPRIAASATTPCRPRRPVSRAICCNRVCGRRNRSRSGRIARRK
ncbi:amino acid adenylation domain-containing protein [Sulfitobacter albidus]|uniref:Amino acid adenylation domain-containing protein n=1 Tax=Sulfitobacter albidus TaxID=2829501 RepID=A0A975JE25_9RHOB|nr:amino acid adenylation domain-containing protein [Sulfitobacter albidus]